MCVCVCVCVHAHISTVEYTIKDHPDEKPHPPLISFNASFSAPMLPS